MNTQNLSTLQVFQSFSHNCKNRSLQSCPKKFIPFLCEFIINLLKGNLQSVKRHHVTKFQPEVRLWSLKCTTWKQVRDILAYEKAYSSLKLLLLPSLTICPNMQQFVLVPASVYNKRLITESLTKQELPKYQLSQNSSYQNDSLRKEINRKIFSKADSLVDIILFCPRIKLSNSKTSILDGAETGSFLFDLFNNCVVKTQTFQIFTLLYLKPLVYLRL